MITITIKDILDKKGTDYYHISPTAPIREALDKMTEKKIGSLIVIEDQKVVGIISERDYVSKVIALENAENPTVRDFMTTHTYIVSPSNTIYEAMSIMTEKKVRHLPVLEVNVITGIVSIGDIVNAIIKQQYFTIKNLEDYITGERYGA
jgi:CBS domain-containing protein